MSSSEGLAGTAGAYGAAAMSACVRYDVASRASLAQIDT
jgi:hypothetical protein